MATEWISPTWRMPNDKNQSKFENYSLDFISTNSERIILDNSVDLGLNSTISLWVNFDTTGYVVLGEDSYSYNYLIYLYNSEVSTRTLSLKPNFFIASLPTPRSSLLSCKPLLAFTLYISF